MVELVTVLAVALLVGGVLGTLVPLVPGGLLSLGGIYLHWWASGFAEPTAGWLVVFTLLGALTLLTEFFGSAVAAKAGGASWSTTAIAVVVAIVLALVTGPVGLLLGLFGTIFALEFVDNGDLDRSARSAVYGTVGVLASTAVQVLLTTTILLAFCLVVFVF